MNYDEAIKTFHNMHPEYDTANIGTYCLHDIILDALKTAKKEHAELSAIKQRAEEYAKDYQLTSEEIYCINYIIKGEGK